MRGIFYHEALERMRKRESLRERVPLRLPVPMPYWPSDSEKKNEGDDENENKGRRVIIIDMNDYSEVEA